MKRLKNSVRPITLTVTAAAATLLVAPAWSPKIGDGLVKMFLPEQAKLIQPKEKTGARSAIAAGALSDASSSFGASLVHGRISGALDPASGRPESSGSSPIDRQFGNLLAALHEAARRYGEEGPFGAVHRRFVTLSGSAPDRLREGSALDLEFGKTLVKLDRRKSAEEDSDAERRRGIMAGLLAAMDMSQAGESSTRLDSSMVAIGLNSVPMDGGSGAPGVVWTPPGGSPVAGSSTTGTSQALPWYGLAPVASAANGGYAPWSGSPGSGSLVPTGPFYPVMAPVWSNYAPSPITVPRSSVSSGGSSRGVSVAAPSTPATAVVSRSLVAAALPASGDTGAGTPGQLQPAAMPQINPLYSFRTSGPNDGTAPSGSLLLFGNTLYGTTRNDFANNLGTIFSVPVTGGTDTILFSFDGTAHGSHPSGSLILNSTHTTFYGTASGGGSNGNGTVFSLPVGGGTATVLFNFDGTSHGATPQGSLILNAAGTTLYGTTTGGGANSDGTVFSLPVTGGTPTVLFSFDGTSHGANPAGSLILNAAGTTLYGTTESGGANGDGTVFSLPVGGGTPTILFSFDNTHGATPTASLLLIGSTLYGTTRNGGTDSEGTVFSLPLTGGTPTILANFDDTHGANPSGSLTLSTDGTKLYGTATNGGADIDGTVFSLPLTGVAGGGSPTGLADFTGGNGVNPEGDLTLSTDGGTVYGTTQSGGTNDAGTVFSLAVPEPSSIWMATACGIAVLGLTRRRSSRRA